MVDTVNIILDGGAWYPTRAHDADAGYDLRARDMQIVPAHGSAVFETGVHIQIPDGYVGMLKSKSGLNVKHGLISDGVIDSGYTGQITAKLYNLSDEDYTVLPGDKITQLVLMPIWTPYMTVVYHFEETERGAHGFGSSGR